MSSSRSDTLSRARRYIGATALLLAVAVFSPGVVAKEATARGRKADITWVEPDGARVTVHARKLRVGYYRRVILSVPKDGRSFKDEERESRGIPLGDRLIKFSRMDKAVFSREEADDDNRPRLLITITLANGKVVTGEGKDLPGAYHPLSPYVVFTVDGVEKRLDLNPMATAESLAGQPSLELIQIVL